MTELGDQLAALMQQARSEEVQEEISPEEQAAERARAMLHEQIMAQRDVLAQTHSTQLHDREIASLTSDMSLEEPAPADEELVVNRYEPANDAQVRQI